jgi:hypothetical protein
LWPIVILASLVAFIVLVLCIPLDAVFYLDAYGKPKFRVRLEWLFGLVSKEIRAKKRKAEVKGAETIGKPRRRKRWSSVGGTFAILRTEGLLKQLKILVKGILSCFVIRDLTIDFRVGLDDPADTGLLFAAINPATIFLGQSFPLRINLEPSFVGEAIIEGHCHGAVRLRPICLSVPLLRFIFSLAAVRVIKKMVLAKWKRRR